MKLYIIRRLKIIFTWLGLHRVFGIFSGINLNLYYMTAFSRWVRKAGKPAYNDFPSKWDYGKRFGLYEHVLQTESLTQAPILYLEFGVAQGESFKWFLERNTHPESRFHGFDTFTGLPEDWGPFKKGYFNNNNKPPEIHDPRGSFHQGLFQQTLPGFLKQIERDRKIVLMLDADLYSSTLFVLTSLAPFLKKDDLIFFDEFAVPTHEFKAFLDFTSAYYRELRLIAAANNYYFAAFKVAQ